MPCLHGPSAVELSQAATPLVRAAGEQRRAVGCPHTHGGWPDAASLPQKPHDTVRSPCIVHSTVVRVFMHARLTAQRGTFVAQDDEQTAEAAAPAVEPAEAADGEPMQTELESPRLMQESQQSPRLHTAGERLRSLQ